MHTVAKVNRDTQSAVFILSGLFLIKRCVFNQNSETDPTKKNIKKLTKKTKEKFNKKKIEIGQKTINWRNFLVFGQNLCASKIIILLLLLLPPRHHFVSERGKVENDDDDEKRMQQTNPPTNAPLPPPYKNKIEKRTSQSSAFTVHPYTVYRCFRPACHRSPCSAH